VPYLSGLTKLTVLLRLYKSRVTRTSAGGNQSIKTECKLGWFLISDTGAISEEDVPDEPIEFAGQKTLSERLRNVLFRVYEARGGNQKSSKVIGQGNEQSYK
jgi:hypothetical protein